MPNTDLTAEERMIVRDALTANNPAKFTNYFLRNKTSGGVLVYPGSVRHQQYLVAWRAQDKPKKFVAESCGVAFEVEPRKMGGTTFFFEHRGFIPLPWSMEMYQAPQLEKYVLGLQGTGKTMGIGAIMAYLCATTPYFKFLNVAPTQKQARQMFNTLRDNLTGTLYPDKFLAWNGKKWWKEQPTLSIEFLNGASMEFMNVEKEASNIQGWYGDAFNMDEAAQLNRLNEDGVEELAAMLPNLASRLRANRPDGTPRMGWQSFISFGYDCDTFWDRFEASLKPSKHTWGKLVTHDMNPYLRPEDIDRIRRSVVPGTEGQYLRGERPQMRGAEISSSLITPLFSKERLDLARTRLEENAEGWRLDGLGDDVRLYEEPPVGGRHYMIAGDPGTGEPPDRNSPTIVVWDITDFPDKKATVAALWWGNGGGSYRPFVSKFAEYVNQYRIAPDFRGYDSTATQKAIAELTWESDGLIVQPLGFDGSKKYQYLVALKLILGKGLMECPYAEGIKRQLARYVLPDKKIAQDWVATFAMSAWLIFERFRAAYPEFDPSAQTEYLHEVDGSGRNYRPWYGRDHARPQRSRVV